MDFIRTNADEFSRKFDEFCIVYKLPGVAKETTSQHGRQIVSLVNSIFAEPSGQASAAVAAAAPNRSQTQLFQYNPGDTVQMHQGFHQHAPAALYQQRQRPARWRQPEHPQQQSQQQPVVNVAPPVIPPINAR